MKEIVTLRLVVDMDSEKVKSFNTPSEFFYTELAEAISILNERAKMHEFTKYSSEEGETNNDSEFKVVVKKQKTGKRIIPDVPLKDLSQLSEGVQKTLKQLPILINGKLTTTIMVYSDITKAELEPLVLNNEIVLKITDVLPIKSFIYIKNKMVNIVI